MAEQTYSIEQDCGQKQEQPFNDKQKQQLFEKSKVKITHDFAVIDASEKDKTQRIMQKFGAALRMLPQKKKDQNTRKL